MDTEVLVVGQAPQHGVWDTADTHLEGSAVGNEAGNDAANLVFDRLGLGRLLFGERGVALDNVV